MQSNKIMNCMRGPGAASARRQRLQVKVVHLKQYAKIPLTGVKRSLACTLVWLMYYVWNADPRLQMLHLFGRLHLNCIASSSMIESCWSLRLQPLSQVTDSQTLRIALSGCLALWFAVPEHCPYKSKHWIIFVQPSFKLSSNNLWCVQILARISHSNYTVDCKVIPSPYI